MTQESQPSAHTIAACLAVIGEDYIPQSHDLGEKYLLKMLVMLANEAADRSSFAPLHDDNPTTIHATQNLLEKLAKSVSAASLSDAMNEGDARVKMKLECGRIAEEAHGSKCNAAINATFHGVLIMSMAASSAVDDDEMMEHLESCATRTARYNRFKTNTQIAAQVARALRADMAAAAEESAAVAPTPAKRAATPLKKGKPSAKKAKLTGNHDDDAPL